MLHIIQLAENSQYFLGKVVVDWLREHQLSIVTIFHLEGKCRQVLHLTLEEQLISMILYLEGEGLLMNDSDFNKVLLLRIRILPPYTYDEDEDERDISEYLAFYKQNLDMSIDSAKKYIEAISC